MFNVSIPKISDEELMRRYQQIKPVIRKDGKLYYLREYSLHELTSVSYLWDADKDLGDTVGKNELAIMNGKDFPCLHSLENNGFFFPTVGEILAQIRTRDIPLVRAFEIIERPKTVINVYKDKFYLIAFNNGYQISTVRLYKEKKWYK